MMILIITLIAGPVGDYLGYDYQFFIASRGYDSLYSIMGDYGDDTIFDTVTVIDTLTYLGYPAYSIHHIRVSDVFALNDTTLCWETGDTLFGYISILDMDTLLAKLYVTPLYLSLQWDLEITGETLIIDIDFDGIDDTLIVQSGDSRVTDSLLVTVPLGSFGAFEVLTTMYLNGWQSYVNDSCRIWVRDYQWLTPYFGVVRDSISFVDSVIFVGSWMEVATGIMYSEAVDSGYVGIAEQQEKVFGSILPIPNGIRISANGNYQIKIYDVLGRLLLRYDMKIDGVKKLKPNLEAGIYFAQIKKENNIATTKFVVIR